MAVFPTTVSVQPRPRVESRAEPRAQRLYFLDNLRVVLTGAVITHHVAMAYGSTGGFWPIREAERTLILSPFFAINRSFGMSLFFLIAGYLTVLSFDRQGARAFVRNHLARLGIPLLVFMLAMMPVLVFLTPPEERGFLGLVEPNALHLWFVEHLLIYSLCYAGLRVLLSRRGRPAANRPAPVPRAPAIIGFALILALASAVVRIWVDIDEWLNLFGFIRVAFADVPRDLSFFVLGTLAYRHGWLAQFPARAGRAWLAAGLVLAALWYVYDLWGSSIVVLAEPFWGLTYAVWESLLCCSMCIGLLVIFRDRLNVQTPLTAELGRSQYLAYIVHIVPVVVLQAAVLALPLPPLAKFLLVTLAAVPATFFVSGLLRRLLRV